MEDSGDERGEANFMADIEVLDALYLRETIESNNQNIQDVVLYWMKKYSECVLAFQDINDAVISHSWGIALHDCAVRELPCMIVQLGITLHNCAVRESPCTIVQLGNCPYYSKS